MVPNKQLKEIRRIEILFFILNLEFPNTTQISSAPFRVPPYPAPREAQIIIMCLDYIVNSYVLERSYFNLYSPQFPHVENKNDCIILHKDGSHTKLFFVLFCFAKSEERVKASTTSAIN